MSVKRNALLWKRCLSESFAEDASETIAARSVTSAAGVFPAVLCSVLSPNQTDSHRRYDTGRYSSAVDPDDAKGFKDSAGLVSDADEPSPDADSPAETFGGSLPSQASEVHPIFAAQSLGWPSGLALPISSESFQNFGASTAASLASDKLGLKPQNREKSIGTCKVCGDMATGKYFGALVCVPCKTFFLRYAGEGFSFVCKGQQNCDISVLTRIQCKYCRYKKCIEAGMVRKVRPLQVEPKEGRQLCVVCSDLGNGVHFGAVTCEGCKKFFRRGLVEHKSYVCKYSKSCPINPQTRNTCRYCRYNKCKNLGMSREAIQMGRPSKVAQKQLTSRPLEKLEMESDESMEADPTCEEAADTSQVLDLSTQSPSVPPESTTAISQGHKRRASASDTMPQFASLPPRFQHDNCLPSGSDTSAVELIVPSFQLLNKNQKIVFKSNKLENDRNSQVLGPDFGQAASSRKLTMSDLVATFGASKLDIVGNSDAHWANDSSSLKDSHPEREDERSKVLASEENLYGGVAQEAARAAAEDPDVALERKIRFLLDVSERYWSTAFPPDENLLLSDERHLDIINNLVPNYDKFVGVSELVNHNLTSKYREWLKARGSLVNNNAVSDWIKTSVIPTYTIISVRYCKKIPGFTSFDIVDQMKIACYGQSPSRILAALLHWFDPQLNDFKDFLTWRDRMTGHIDRFKRILINFANNIQLLQLDPIEAALLNALVIVATDYPGLVNKQVIETARVQIISTFRAYSSAKFGPVNNRVEKLFEIIPEIRKMGFVHHEMTNTRTMRAEEFGERLLTALSL